MAQCKLTPREFISNTFSPKIGAICSPAAEYVCQKNNLSFIELLQPFSNFNSEGHIKDPQGTIVNIRNLHLSIQDINSQPPEPTIARKLLNDSVNIEQCDRTTNIKINNNNINNIDIPISVSWFESWREMFLNVQFPSDHEFTKHFIACMIVVSTSDDNPLDKIQQIGQKLCQTSTTKLPKWFNNNALRYYILIYDSTQDDKIKAEKIFTDMKNIYDKNNCYLLSMNSRKIDNINNNNNNNNINLPDPWCQFLIKKNDDIIGLSDTNSSPRTPADTGCISSMPNRVSTSDSDKTSQASTPVLSQNPILLSPNDTDKISLTSELNDVPNINVEIGQEAVPVLLHPLSPVDIIEKNLTIDTITQQQQQQQLNDTTTTTKTYINEKINDNVWADQPNTELQIHGALLSTQDLEKIRLLINEFCIKSLFPYIEKQLLLLNDVISNKKGVSRSLFSATKRWFGTTKPGAPNSTPSNAVIYSIDSSELQLRRFGDLCFMIGHYSLAYQAYHTAKRDFQADQAWLYYAGALEMAGLSAFMQGENDRKTIQYLDDAILTYLNTCKMSQFAVRTTLLSTECLKGRNLYNDAAKQLIRMTSEDSDLRSALLLEQASYCYIHSKMFNKYAFHIVLAGHRYSKSGQKKHSLRCYQQAYQIYYNKGWSLAEDHINFTIGRQSASLKQIKQSIKSFEKLLNPLSKQSSIQQSAFLREFLQIQNLLINNNTDNDNNDKKNLPILTLPIIDNDNNIKIHCGHIINDNNYNIFDDNYYNINDENKWSKLEEIIITEIQGTPPMIFEPTVAIYSNKSNNNNNPIGIIDEPIYISIVLYNPLRINLTICNIKLIWTFKNNNNNNNNDELITNEIDNDNNNYNDIIETSIIDKLLLTSMSKKNIILSVKPKYIGELKILGISYNLTNIIDNINNDNLLNNLQNNIIIVNGKKLFNINNKKLNNNDNNINIDKRLNINIIDKSPFLNITFTKLINNMICGEIQEIIMTIKNIGNSSLKNLLISSKNIDLFTINNKLLNNNNIKSNYIFKINILNDYLEPNKSFDIKMWIKAPHNKGNHKLDLLFYYENINNNNNNLLKYRLQRHSWLLNVFDSINIKTIIHQSILINNNLPTLNLVLQIKNNNQVNDLYNNDITLTNISLKSNNWILGKKIDNKIIHKIQSQEIYNLLLKINRRFINDDDDNNNNNDELTNISFIDNDNINDIPYIDFIDKLKLLSLNNIDNDCIINNDNNKIDNLNNLNMTLIIRWKANIMENKNLIRQAIGQHHLELNVINKIYKHPEDVLITSSDYPTRLIIFGPDRNVPNTDIIIKNDNINCNKIPNNIITFSLKHQHNIINNFDEKKICIVPVTMNIQNHSSMKLQVKIDTIGTSSKKYLPSIKSQLYTPKASTFFRYACHTAINCHIEPLGYHIVELKAIVLSSGTFDLASRIEISAKTIDIQEFILQKWQIESVCSVSDVND